MQIDDFEATMQSFKRRSPFRPFTVELFNGNRVEVDRADALLVRDGLGAYIAPGGIPVIFDYEGVSQINGDPDGTTE